jgi:phage terminase large subunit-like protein
MIREIDDDDDPHDKSCWPKANPIFQNRNEYSDGLYEEMESEYNLAFGSGDPSKIRQWMIKRVNRFQSGSENKYFSGCMDKWKSLAISRPEFLRLVAGCECINGDDLSKSIDLTATGYVFELDDGRFAVCAHGFIPEDTVVKHEHTDKVPYRAWAEDGWCTITRNAVTDDRDLIQQIHDMEFDYKWKIKEVCYDPYTARQFSNVLSDEGYTCVEVRQGYVTLSEPTKKLREMTLQGKIVHDGSPLLTWCLSNAVEVIGEGSLIKLSKKHKDDTQRIDLAAAIINALFRALLAREKRCVYSATRGILEV